MKSSPQFIVYLLGIVLLGVSHASFSSALGGNGLFLVGAVLYLLWLRFTARYAAKWLAARRKRRGGS